MKKLTALIVVFTLCVFATSFLAAEEKSEEKKFEYIGVDKCKFCHKKDGTYPSWLETGHAKAWENLSEEDRKREECIGCHITGETAKGEVLHGVQCEACHGPGSEYKSMKIMKDRELSIANGLLIPDTTTCMQCHNENVPEEFQPEEGYDFVEMMKTGVHDMPPAEEK